MVVSIALDGSIDIDTCYCRSVSVFWNSNPSGKWQN